MDQDRLREHLAAERGTGDDQVVAFADFGLPHGDRLGCASWQQLEEHAARILKAMLFFIFMYLSCALYARPIIDLNYTIYMITLYTNQIVIYLQDTITYHVPKAIIRNYTCVNSTYCPICF